MRARLPWPLLLLPILLSLGACSTNTAPARPPPATPPHASPGLARFDAAPGIFPGRWHRPGVEVHATALAPARRSEARVWLDAALAKYPPGFLAQHVQAVHVLGALRFRGVDAGGSNSRRRVYVVMPQGHAARIYFERVVHAEISSILLRRRPDLLDEAAWRRCLLPGARYGSTGAAAVRHGVARTWPTEWTLKQGFLYEYGMSSLENDVNSYAGFAFTHPRRLRELASRWHAVGHKRSMILAFYLALDPRFAPLNAR